MKLAQNAKVVWLDDDPHILSALSRDLSAMDGVGLVTFLDPEEALHYIVKHQPEVIVSDQRMPKITGIEFLRDAKQKCPLATQMLMTAFNEGSLIKTAVNELGLFRVLSKPWDKSYLINDIRVATTHALNLKKHFELKSILKNYTADLENLTSSFEVVAKERTKPLERAMLEKRKRVELLNGFLNLLKKTTQLRSIDRKAHV